MRHLPRVFRGRRRWLLVRLVANGVGQALAMAATLFLVRGAFRALVRLSGTELPSRMLWLALGLGAVAVAQGWLRYRERVDAELLGQGYVHHLRLLLFDHLKSLAPRVLRRRSGGAVLLRFVGDMTALRNWVALGVARGSVALLTVVLALAVLAAVDWVLGLAVAAFLSLGLAQSVASSKRLRESALEARRRRARLAANIGEKVNELGVVKAFGQEDRELRRLRRHSQRLRTAMVAQARSAGVLRAASEGAAVAARGLVLFFGAIQVSRGSTTPDTVVAALTIVALLSPRVRELGRVFEYRARAQVSRKKILEFLRTPTLAKDAPGAPDLVPGPGRLEFDRVTLGDAVRDFTSVAEPGTVVALVGPSGAGKSTLLDLAARLVDPDEGSVRLDGQELRAHSLASVRRAIGMVSPDLPLLRGSLRRNLLYRAPKAAPEEVARVAALCGVDGVVADLPEGLDTRVQEGGRNLSAGQRQRIALARALLGCPKVLLLDEADANLDAEALDLLDRVLREFRGTVLLVTHAPERAARAEAVWHLEGGRLVACGPPARGGTGR